MKKLGVTVLCLFMAHLAKESRIYGMSGYIYEHNIKLETTEKKLVFEKANAGWFPYFTKGDDGQILLRHFSYAGRLDLISLKNQNGKWITQRLQNITPEEAKARYLKQL